MAIQKFRESVPATTTIEVALGPARQAGPRGGQVSLWAVAATANTVDATLMVGTDTLLNSGVLNVAGAVDRVSTQDDLVARGFAAPFDPVILRLTNRSAGAIICNGIVEVA